jgi:hypothetical protein
MPVVTVGVLHKARITVLLCPMAAVYHITSRPASRPWDSTRIGTARYNPTSRGAACSQNPGRFRARRVQPSTYVSRSHQRDSVGGAVRFDSYRCRRSTADGQTIFCTDYNARYSYRSPGRGLCCGSPVINKPLSPPVAQSAQTESHG